MSSSHPELALFFGGTPPGHLKTQRGIWSEHQIPRCARNNKVKGEHKVKAETGHAPSLPDVHLPLPPRPAVSIVLAVVGCLIALLVRLAIPLFVLVFAS